MDFKPYEKTTKETRTKFSRPFLIARSVHQTSSVKIYLVYLLNYISMILLNKFLLK